MFQEMKLQLQDEELNKQFGHDEHPSSEYIDIIYNQAMMEASEETNDDIYIEPSAQSDDGVVDLYSNKGRARWGFKKECETLLEYAQKATSEEDFKNMIKAFILEKYKGCSPEFFYISDDEEAFIDDYYHDASEEELRDMGCFDNLNEE